jgi:diaminopimelate decarboxylase
MKFLKAVENYGCAEAVPLQTIATYVGTPCYIYSRTALEANWKAFDHAFGTRPHQINYAVKANSNLAVLNILARLGSGFDIVSGGELERVLAAGGKAEQIVFSGVGKTMTELRRALEIGVGCINIESEAELLRLNTIAVEMNKKAKIALRINPDVHSQSHPYISTGLKENKFGIDILDAKAVYQQALNLEGIEIFGVACHIGSQITAMEPFLEALTKILELIHDLKMLGINIFHLNLGGGLGVRYQNETPPDPTTYVKTLLSYLPDTSLNIHLEPGRAITANAGILLTKVEYIKQSKDHHKNFAIVDAAMNDLLRPALYQAWQEIVLVNRDKEETKSSEPTSFCRYDIVGPVCETGDFLGKDRLLPTLKPNDLLAILSAGAYGFSMCSNYNSRPKLAEVMVDGEAFHIIRPRENLADLFKSEKMIP